jgi:hypothetical protein
MNTRFRIAFLPLLLVAFSVGACGSTAEVEWSPHVENLYAFSGESPDGPPGEKPELALPIQLEVKRIRRRVDAPSEYGLAQEPNPPAPCREWEFDITFRQPNRGGVIASLRASTDEKGILRVPVPVAVREQGSRGRGVDLSVRAVLPTGAGSGHMHRTARESESRVRFDGGYVLSLPEKTLADLWLRFGDREL